MPVVVNGSTYAGAENAQDAAHTRKKNCEVFGDRTCECTAFTYQPRSDSQMLFLVRIVADQYDAIVSQQCRCWYGH